MGIETYIPYIIVAVIAAIVVLNGIKIIRPTHRAAVETLGKFTGFKEPGMTFVIPIFQKLYSLNITEQLVDVERQDVITKDNLNCRVDAQVYYKIGDHTEDMQNALYNVNNVNRQMVQLAKTTLRDIIGRKEFEEVNSNRSVLNALIFESIEKETVNWGVKVVRVELKEIEPPEDVQTTMNDIIKANNTKVAAKDFAEAEKTKAYGEKLATIERAEGEKKYMIEVANGKKESQVLIAKGEAEAIKTVAAANANKYEVESKALTEHFKATAITHKELETTQISYKDNAKIIVADSKNPLNLVVNESGKGKVIPMEVSERKPKRSDYR
jgi:regulator of protease activity HflC (stomatin/prohibitin superfamily)